MVKQQEGLRQSSILRGWVDKDVHRHKTCGYFPMDGWTELVAWEQCRCYREAGDI